MASEPTVGRLSLAFPAMWLDGALHFATGLEEQKGRHLSRNPNCVLTTGTNAYRRGLDVVVSDKDDQRGARAPSAR